MNTQVEQDAVQIMQFLVEYRDCFPAMARSEKNLSTHLGIPIVRITAASIYLTGQGFAKMRGIHIEADDAGDGERWLLGVTNSPYFQLSDAKWKAEVLEGMKTSGKPTDIENPVVPGNAPPPSASDSEWRYVSMVDRLIMARASGYDLPQIEERIKGGLSKVCKGYRRPVHLVDVGGFYQNSRTALCKECLKVKNAQKNK
jgi:hypothetical protein